MNDLAPIQSGALSIATATTTELREPLMSRDLALDVARLSDTDREARALRHFDPRSVSPAQREEAEWAAEQFRALLAPVTRAQLAAWLGSVNAGCRNPQDRDAFTVRLNAIAQDCGHLPAGCFTTESRRALYGETRFFPAAGDVLAVLEPIEQRLRGKIAALDRIAAPVALAAEQPAGRTPRSQGEIDAVAATLTQWRKDMAAQRQELEAGSEGRPVSPRYVAPALLAIEYRKTVAAGGPMAAAAALRLQALEKRNGLGTPGR
ncbi:hypothetical protein [Roseomonas indoligenes]|uniref:Uncharacterized protein n=1 Tax=Roseomonas indoligenes TaxID=2820811 RepID=A0A940S4L5_9PROT|nr:hypothetical protein [Pararoseomonas indoligenes]MBP0492104.1 hypothetical protein [Pararoseomonas indoligenes]